MNASNQISTAEWASRLGIATGQNLPPIEDSEQSCPFSAREIATRALVLHGVVAVASDVSAEPIATWFREQGIWSHVSPEEVAFLREPTAADRETRDRLQWRQEAEWTLLWAVGKVESLGLPIRRCDSRRLCDEIVPAFGTDVEAFLASASLRTAGELLAEDDRNYDLWCRYFQTRRAGLPLPGDLDLGVLYERRYAFEWLDAVWPWDDVKCDA